MQIQYGTLESNREWTRTRTCRMLSGCGPTAPHSLENNPPKNGLAIELKSIMVQDKADLNNRLNEVVV
eukprot:1299218-Amphidinium_carterae.1